MMTPYWLDCSDGIPSLTPHEQGGYYKRTEADAYVAALRLELAEAREALRVHSSCSVAQLQQQCADLQAKLALKEKMLDGLPHDYCELERGIEALGIKLTDDYGALDPEEELMKFVKDLQRQLAEAQGRIKELESVCSADYGPAGNLLTDNFGKPLA